MTVRDAIVETLEYTVVLVDSESRKVLARAELDSYRLPSVLIPQWRRPAEELQKAIRAEWGVQSIVLMVLPAINEASACVVAQILSRGIDSALEPVELRSLPAAALEGPQRHALESLLRGDGGELGPFARIGWIEDAVSWMEASTGASLARGDSIEQYNAGGHFSLLRFRTEDSRVFWMKATGSPNTHELPVTAYLGAIGGIHLPRLVAMKPEWNAWLMSGEGTSLREPETNAHRLAAVLESASKSMVGLQKKMQGNTDGLLEAGAFDQSAGVLLSRASEMFDYAAESMCLQVSSKAPRLSTGRIEELRFTFERVCLRLQELSLGDSIVHGDLNLGNIVVSEGGCQFIDWAEAYVGNPLVSLHNLLLLVRGTDEAAGARIAREVTARYLLEWNSSYGREVLREALAYLPALGVASALYGRGDWLSSPLREDSTRRAYARTLTRYLDRAVRAPDFEEMLCH
jgi:hypothetical protein